MSKIASRKDELKTGKFWIVSLFMLSINIFLVYLLLGYIEILYVTIGFAALTFLLFIIRLVRNWKARTEIEYPKRV